MSEKIKYDSKNYRKHNERNKELIKKSLEECGGARSIVIDSENEIICGNGCYEQAQKLKMPVRIIETDGKELIAVKRVDLKTSDEKRKKLSVYDNSTSDTSEFDLDLLQEDFLIDELNDFGIEIFNNTSDFNSQKLIEDFKEYNEDTKTKYKCPKCGYEYN